MVEAHMAAPRCDQLYYITLAPPSLLARADEVIE
jgi:hypothetical protein